MSTEQHQAAGILTANVDTIEMTPADYTGVAVRDASDAGPGGKWGQICTPEDGLALQGAGVFECDPHTIVVPVESDEFLYLIEGELSIEQEDGGVVDVTAGTMVVLPKGRTYTLRYKTHCRQLFAIPR